MKKVISLMLAMMMLMLFASAAFSESQGKEMYVYTKNGRVLKVRSSMSTKDDRNVIGSLKYGAKVIVYGVKDGWAMIDYNSTTGYILYRYLVKTKPASYTASGTAGQTLDEASIKDASTVSQLNALAASVKYADQPYTVTVRPVQSGGKVYMRWYPSKTAKEITTFSADYELTVIAELKDWYQVSDPATGRVGFVYKSYVQ